MRCLRAVLAAVGVLTVTAHPAAAGTEFEVRASTADYRVADLSHTFDGGLVLDAFYVGDAGSNVLHAGAGYDFGSDDRTSVIPILYAVVGSDYGQRGVTLAAFLSLSRGNWETVAFVGRFFRREGEVPDYSFVDSLDLTRAFGRWKAGASLSAYRFAGSSEDDAGLIWLTGPVLKREDRFGTWAASVRFGSLTEFRVGRIIGF